MEIKTEYQKLLNYYNSRKFDLVINKSKGFIKNFGAIPEVYNLVGLSYEMLNKKIKAIENFEKSLELNTKNVSALVNLGNNHKDLKNFKKSEEYYKKLIEVDPNYIRAYANYGNLLRMMNEYEGAIEKYKQGIKIYEKSGKQVKHIQLFYYNLGLAYQSLGDFDKTIEQAKIVLKYDPRFTRADLLISGCKKYQSKNDVHINEMEHKLKNIELSRFGKVCLYYSLGKAYEDVKDYENSFNNLKLANDGYREILSYNFKEEVDLFKYVKDAFKNFQIKEKPDVTKKRMIFILGMPRSGTTLMEQIITTDKNISGGGEMDVLPNLVGKYFAKDRIKGELSDINEILKQNDINKIVDEFYSNLNKINLNKNIITDKSPLNFLWIGFIKLIFPNAKVINCTRDPLNNCFSIYKLLFEGNLYWSYSLADVANYYNLYRDLMKFWKKKYPEFICDAPYEEIVNNPKKSIKEITEFCNLEWSDDFLKFYNNKKPIKTNSSNQARQPLYKSSLNISEKYGEHLNEMSKILDS